MDDADLLCRPLERLLDLTDFEQVVLPVPATRVNAVARDPILHAQRHGCSQHSSTTRNNTREQKSTIFWIAPPGKDVLVHAN